MSELLQILVKHDVGNTGIGAIICSGYSDMTLDGKYDSETTSVHIEGDPDFNDWDDETEFRNAKSDKMDYVDSLVQKLLELGFLHNEKRFAYIGLQYNANLDRLSVDGGEGEVGILDTSWEWDTVLNENRVTVSDAYIAAKRAVAEKEASIKVLVASRVDIAGLDALDIIINMNFSEVI
jgi:hypothetical protein